LTDFVADLERAELRLAARAASVPTVTYPADLPISARRDEIVAALRGHQVLVVTGETGSGKTTQLPKMCLEVGRGVRGQIGHTQPRRLAARTVAERLAEELDSAVGEVVGWTVRFTERASGDSLVRVMTDGILLAQIGRDPRLLAYDTVIVDEAHERSLNIDFLLGYLHRLLPQRPELKLVITSATIDPGRFAAHFRTAGTPAPVIEVSGRSYPVEIRYRPLLPDEASEGDLDEPRDQTTAVCDAVAELLSEGPGDMLVFVSGEREIRDTADALRARSLPIEVLPLYARLSVADQHRVFAPHTGRRVVLATNVAETSLTIPGIRYVIDAGTARVSRYNARRKVQRLPIEPVSRASADQRAGRCGRLAAGVCIRLYSRADYAGRPAFTDPEILRTSLASVILQMAALELGEVADFGFLDPPDRRAVTDGVTLLVELGALTGSPDTPPVLTGLGRKLAALPVDPRFARMLVEADRVGALREVIVIVAALSIQDPREHPAEALDSARAKHARFADPTSDFLAWLNLWAYLRERQAALSSAAFRRLCATDNLHYLRVREWQDLVAQLRELTGALGLRWNSDPAPAQQVHLALLCGLLTQIGMQDPIATEGTFLGTRNTRFAVFPGSGLAKRPPRWIMAAELVETSRLWARTVARIEPGWVEPLAAHLVSRQYSEPHWDPERGSAVATERVSLHGLPLVVGRRVDYARIDAAGARELFIRRGLVEGEWRARHRFLEHNRALRHRVGELEERTRRRGLVIDDAGLFAFYDARLPPEICSAAGFNAWWKTERRGHPHALDLDEVTVRSATAVDVAAEDYPTDWTRGDLRLKLHYEFSPGTEFDGVTVDVPLPVLNRIGPDGFDWGIPGLREELVVALIRSLPKGLRRGLSPAPTYAAAVLPRLDPARGEPITAALGRELQSAFGVRVESEDWDWARVPGHLRMTFRLVAEDGRTLAVDKDLLGLRARFAPAVAELVSAGAAAFERSGLTAWPDLSGAAAEPDGIDRLPATHEYLRDGHVVRGFPALVDEGGTVAVRVLPDADSARTAMWAGTRRLLLRIQPPPVRQVLAALNSRDKLALAAAPHAGGAELFDDCATAAADAVLREHGGPARDRAGFEVLLRAVRAELPARLTAVVTDVVRILTVAQEVDAALAAAGNSPYRAAVTDMRTQHDGLLHPGFVAATGAARLPDLPRYLRGIARRLERLPADPVRDGSRMATVTQVSREFAQFRAALPIARRSDEDVVAIRWMIEELRVSLFAQALGTAAPVSEKRILRAMDAAEARVSA